MEQRNQRYNNKAAAPTRRFVAVGVPISDATVGAGGASGQRSKYGAKSPKA